jgi:F0F1-type ATP synthase assembly protein I
LMMIEMSREMKNYMIVIVCGIVIALASAVYTQDLTVGVGARLTGYGFPLPWLIQRLIIVPGATPTYELQATGLVADLAVWIIIVLVIYEVVKRVKK